MNNVSFGQYYLIYILVKEVILEDYQFIDVFWLKRKLKIDKFDFSNGFKCSDDHWFEKLASLSKNVFKVNFHQVENEWKHKSIPIQISKNASDRVVDLLIFKNHYVRNKKLHVFFEQLDLKLVCIQCLSSYSSQNVLKKRKHKCEQQQMTSIITSNGSQIYWNKYFYKNPLQLKIYADFVADNENENSYIDNKTTNIYRQNQIYYGYYIVS